MDGKIVGAAVVSHHPGLMQCEEFRVLQGAGQDSDLIAGYARLRQKIAAAAPQVVVIFDSHWFTTGYHLVDGGERYCGTYISDEMPWYLHGVPYDYRGHPGLAALIETVSRERGGYNRVIAHPDLGRQYATINLDARPRVQRRRVLIGGGAVWDTMRGVGHAPTDTPEVRSVALGFDERVPERLRDNLREARGG